jgi:hypothetical protein
MVNSKEYKGFIVYSNGTIYRPTQKRTRRDGVVREIKGGWVATRVRNADTGKGGGYEYVDLWINNKTEYWLMHRLVAKLFVDNPNNYPQVNHKDGNRSNNDASNLEWVSASENQKHAYNSLGRQRKGKLSDEQKKEVWKLRNIDKLKLNEIASRFGIAFQTVSDIASGNRFVMREEVI